MEAKVEQRVITSSVFKTAEEVAPWYNASLLTPHEPIRHFLAEMVRVLRPESFSGSLDKWWKVTRFFSFYTSVFEPFVHHHHDTEETIFVPWMKTRCEIPHKMTADHKELLRQLHGVAETKAEFDVAFAEKDQARATAAADSLRNKVKELSDLMLDHLAEEEEQIAPLLKQHFTQKEHDALVDRIIKSFPPSDLYYVLPFVYSHMEQWAGSKAFAQSFGSMPPPLRWLYSSRWQPRFAHDVDAALASIAEDNDTWKPRSSKCIVM